MEDVDLDGTIVLTFILKEYDGRGLDSSGSG